MRKNTANENNADLGERDLRSYREFLHLWHTGTLTEDNEVYQKVENSSRQFCREYGRPERVMDACHSCLATIAEEQFDGGSLDDRIVNILKTVVLPAWSFCGDLQGRERAGQGINTGSLRVVEEVFRRLNSEPHMRSMLASRPELRRNIIDLILASDCYGTAFQEKILKTLIPTPIATPRRSRADKNKHSVRTAILNSVERLESFFHIFRPDGLLEKRGNLDH